jgi:hypothetical protein
MGVVYNLKGPPWALRVKKDDQAIADMKAKLDPELSDEVGRPLMAATLGLGKRYILKNIEAGWTFIDVVKMLKASLKWSVRPERFLKATGKNSNNLVIFAVTEPPTSFLQVSGTTRYINIVDFKENLPRKDGWDTMVNDFLEKQYNEDKDADAARSDDQNKWYQDKRSWADQQDDGDMTLDGDAQGDFYKEDDDDDIDGVFTPTFARQPISSASAPSLQQLHQRRIEDEHKIFWHPAEASDNTQKPADLNAAQVEFKRMLAEQAEAQCKAEKQIEEQQRYSKQLKADMDEMSKDLNTMFSGIRNTIVQSEARQASVEAQVKDMNENMKQMKELLTGLSSMVREQKKQKAETSDEQPDVKVARTTES